MDVKAPFFISTEYDSFEQYIKKLTFASRRKYNKVMKKYHNIEYCKLSTTEGINIRSKLENIWSKQIVRGKIAGNFTLPLKNNTHFFACKLNNECIMLQFVEYNKNYIYCHMPMYDKELYPELSKYAWFNLIRYTIENTSMIGIDMGGTCGRDRKLHAGKHGSHDFCNPHFKYIIENRKKLKKYEYKFLYLTKEEKNINNAKKLIIVNNEVVQLK